MELSLRDLQLLANAEYSIEQTRADLREIVDYFKAQERQSDIIEIALVRERQIPRAIADETEAFFVEEDLTAYEIPEKFRVEALGFVRYNNLVFSGRLVYPIKDSLGQVMGFCGWDPFVKPKYLDSRNHGYKAKATTFYGMEKMPEYYANGKPIYVVEGIIDCLYLRSIGLQAIALLGSSITTYVYHILKRVEKRLIFIPDNDVVGKSIEVINESNPAGEHFVQQVKRQLPKAMVIQCTLANDVDEARKMDDHKYEETFKRELNEVALCPFAFFKTIRVR